MIIQSILPLRRDWHVTFDRSCMFWKVKQEYRADHWGMAITKTEAIAMGMMQARLGHESLIIHGMDGKIQTVYNYDKFRWPD